MTTRETPVLRTGQQSSVATPRPVASTSLPYVATDAASGDGNHYVGPGDQIMIELEVPPTTDRLLIMHWALFVLGSGNMQGGISSMLNGEFYNDEPMSMSFAGVDAFNASGHLFVGTLRTPADNPDFLGIQRCGFYIYGGPTGFSFDHRVSVMPVQYVHQNIKIPG